MNRVLLTVSGMLGASGLLLLADSAVKGAALLLLAGLTALVLRRDSAATRHLVWLLALAMMLAVPVLSALLPRWRVLPEWARVSTPASPQQVTQGKADAAAPVARAEVPVEQPQHSAPVRVERAATEPPPAHAPAARDVSDVRPASVTPAGAARVDRAGPATQSWKWFHVLPLIWVIGFG